MTLKDGALSSRGMEPNFEAWKEEMTILSVYGLKKSNHREQTLVVMFILSQDFTFSTSLGIGIQ